MSSSLYREKGIHVSPGRAVGRSSPPFPWYLNLALYLPHYNLTPVLQRTVRFCEQLSTVIPNSHVYYRRGLALKRIIPQCIARDFTDLIVINEDRKIPSILLCIYQSRCTVLIREREEFFSVHQRSALFWIFFLHCAAYSLTTELKITVPAGISDG